MEYNSSSNSHIRIYSVSVLPEHRISMPGVSPECSDIYICAINSIADYLIAQLQQTYGHQSTALGFSKVSKKRGASHDYSIDVVVEDSQFGRVNLITIRGQTVEEGIFILDDITLLSSNDINTAAEIVRGVLDGKQAI
jgi:disulfide oxidoreductase YuzD